MIHGCRDMFPPRIPPGGPCHRFVGPEWDRETVLFTSDTSSETLPTEYLSRGGMGQGGMKTLLFMYLLFFDFPQNVNRLNT